jgi:hypothetical protein
MSAWSDQTTTAAARQKHQSDRLLVGGITAMVLSFADDDGALPARLAMLAMGCAIAWAALAGAGFTVLVLGLAALLQKQTGLRRTQLVKLSWWNPSVRGRGQHQVSSPAGAED